MTASSDAHTALHRRKRRGGRGARGACGLTRPWNDPRRDIARKLEVQCSTSQCARQRQHAFVLSRSQFRSGCLGPPRHRRLILRPAPASLTVPRPGASTAHLLWLCPLLTTPSALWSARPNDAGSHHARTHAARSGRSRHPLLTNESRAARGAGMKAAECAL
jgi:hypothetical protein